MTITSLLSRESNQDFSRTKKAMEIGSVFIADRGKSAHALLSIDHYHKLTGQEVTLIESATQLDAPDLEFTPPRVGRVITAVAQCCARLHVPDLRGERDALIAATALAHRLTVVTRDFADFDPTGARPLNPWG